MSGIQLLQGDALEVLRTLPSESVHCVVTSPPYYRLRDYGVDGQIGLEHTPQDFVERLVAVFEEVKRVLHDTGIVWLNIGDSYTGSGKGPASPGTKQSSNPGSYQRNSASLPSTSANMPPGMKRKNLLGIPWRLAFALQDAGWYLRRDIIWYKLNRMSESVRDRPTTSHEYIFLFSKKARYFYDNLAIREPLNPEVAARYNRNSKYDESAESPYGKVQHGPRGHSAGLGANIHSVWPITLAQYHGDHSATFPEEIPNRCILLGTSERGVCAECLTPWAFVEEKKEAAPRDNLPNTKYAKGTFGYRLGQLRDSFHAKGKEYMRPLPVGEWKSGCECGAGIVPARVLDLFVGSGTTGMVANRLGRDFIGIDLDPKSIEQSRKRIFDDAPMLVKENHNDQD